MIRKLIFSAMVVSMLTSFGIVSVSCAPGTTHVRNTPTPEEIKKFEESKKNTVVSQTAELFSKNRWKDDNTFKAYIEGLNLTAKQQEYFDIYWSKYHDYVFNPDIQRIVQLFDTEPWIENNLVSPLEWIIHQIPDDLNAIKQNWLGYEYARKTINTLNDYFTFKFALIARYYGAYNDYVNFKYFRDYPERFEEEGKKPFDSKVIAALYDYRSKLEAYLQKREKEASQNSQVNNTTSPSQDKSVEAKQPQERPQEQSN